MRDLHAITHIKLDQHHIFSCSDLQRRICKFLIEPDPIEQIKFVLLYRTTYPQLVEFTAASKRELIPEVYVIYALKLALGHI